MTGKGKNMKNPKKSVVVVLIFALCIEVCAFPAILGGHSQETIPTQRGNEFDSFKASLKDKKMTDDIWIEQAKLVNSDGGSNDYFGSDVLLDGEYALISAHGSNYFTGGVYVFHFTGDAWVEQEKLIPSDAVRATNFGVPISLDGDYALIGGLGNDNNGHWSGAAYVFHRNGSSWIEQAKLMPSDGAEDDRFCIGSIDGDYAVVGSPGDDDNGESSGSAYVFQRNGTSWTEQFKLKPSDGEENASFGQSVSLDGDIVVIGAKEKNGDGKWSGSAYVFQRNGTSWIEQFKLKPSEGEENDGFGWSVCIRGNNILVGARAANNFEGAVYVYHWNGSNWNEQAKLTASDGEEYDWFGSSVSIEDDLILIGSTRQENDNGAVYVYHWNGSNWNEQAKLTASDGEENDWFGHSVSIEDDFILIGASGDDDNGLDSGAAYVFRRALENLAPSTPVISGPVEGKRGVKYFFNISSDDQDGDQIRYFIDWGDSSENGTGFFSSGETVSICHTWVNASNYTIRVKASDRMGMESSWQTLPITMPKMRDNPWIVTMQNIINWLVERIPSFGWLMNLFGSAGFF